MTVDPTSSALGQVVVSLLVQAAEAWGAGDERAAARWCAAAWRLVGDGEFLDVDEWREQRR